MIPNELVVHNFMCYRDNLPPLRFDGLHVTCLSGENGAGKSALLDAITWALWGKARMHDDDLIAQGANEMLVELTFLLNNQTYRIRRQRQRARSGKRSSGKTTLDMLIRDEHQGEARWRSIGGNTVTETERLIEALLRMKYDTFINASFLVQGRADEFTRKTAGERKQVLADILDLRDYAALEERANARKKHLNEQITTLDGRIAHLQQESDKCALYQRLVAEGETRVAALAAAHAQAQQEKETADETVRTLETKQARYRELVDKLTEVRQQHQQQQQEIAELQAAITDAEALLEREAEIAAGAEALAAARHELERLETLRPRYDELVAQRRELQDALKDERRTLLSEQERLQDEAQRTQDQLAYRPTIQADLHALAEQLAALKPHEEELDSVKKRRLELDDRISQVNPLLLKHANATSTINQRHDTLHATVSDSQRRIERLEQELTHVEQWHSDLNEARQQRQTAQSLTESLTDLRQREQKNAEQLGELRGQAARLKEDESALQSRRDMLTQTATTTCPLCHSDLGERGITTVATHYDQEIATLRQRHHTVYQQVRALENQQEQLRSERKQQEARLETARQGAARIESLQQQLEYAQRWETELDEARTTLAEALQRLAANDYEPAAREALITIEANLRELGAVLDIGKKSSGESDISYTAAPLEKERKTLHKRQGELEGMLMSRSGMESKAATLRHRLEEVTRLQEALPELEQRIATLAATIEAGDYAHDIRTRGRAIEADMDALGYTSAAHEAARERVQQLLPWDEEAQRLTLARTTLERDRRTITRAEELLTRYQADITQYAAESAALEQEVRALPAAHQHASTCARTLDEHQRDLDSARRDLTEKQTLHTRALEDAQQLAEKQTERAALVERQSLFDELTKAFGKKGVQAMLIETAIPELEREANRLLSRITDNQMHVTFDTQRSTKKGDTVETLEIKIADTLGTRAYDSFSGGEATRINFAIRIALSRLLSRRAGASLETLVIDEGMSALDADGRERFIEAITSIQHDFQRILVITHLDELKERFPARITITKGPAGSQFEIG